MSRFHKNMVHILTEYKRLLRRYLTPQEKTEKVKALGLKRTTLREDNDIVLLEKAKAVLKDIELMCQHRNSSCGEHSGLDHFHRHLRSAVENAHINPKHKVVNKSYRCASAMIETLQLISLPAERINQAMLDKIKSSIRCITNHGSHEEQKKCLKALHHHKEVNCKLTQLIHFFEQQQGAQQTEIH